MKHSFRFSILLSLLAAILPAQPATQPKTAGNVTFYLSPQGSDTYSGRIATPNPTRTDGPFATFERAQQAVRLEKSTGVSSITVLLKGGTYYRTRTLHLTLDDSAMPGQTITWAAAPGESAVLSAGLPISNWTLQDPPGAPAVSKGKVYAASVAHVLAARKAAALPHGEGLPLDPVFQDRLMTLWGKDRGLPRARSKGFRAVEEVKDLGPNRSRMALPPGVGAGLANPSAAELLIIPMHYWIMNLLPIVSIDRGAGALTTALPGTYAFGRNPMDDRDTAFLENAPEDLTQPGNWIYDATIRRVYVFSPAGPPLGIVAPVLSELVRIEGAIRYAEGRDTPVQGLTLRGLTLTHGERVVFQGGTGWGLQHDWEMFDRPTALVRLRGAERCAVEECLFTDSGHAGIRLDLHCVSNRIQGNELRQLGGCAILLAGYGPGLKDVNTGNELRNNYIHHIGRQYWGSPALFLWQSGGNLVAHNHLHHVPYAGIVISGRIGFSEGTNFPHAECSRTVRWQEVKPALGTNWRTEVRLWEKKERFLHGRGNLVEHNDIHNIMESLGDGNAIYISGTGGGNVVRENHIHDCVGRYMNAVIRNDDDQHGSTFDGNLIARSGGWGEAFINKGSNHMRQNVVADLRGHEGHRAFLVLNTSPQTGSTLERNLFYSTRKGQRILSEQEPNPRNQAGSRLAQFSAAEDNLFWCAEDPQWAEAYLADQRSNGFEKKSRCADPQFEDPTLERSFRFKAGSPALALGIRQPFDLARAGLEEPWRSRRIGDALRTRATPDRDSLLWSPVPVTLASSDPAAAIRYTLDGTEPGENAAIYTGPLLISAPSTLKARSFARGKQDLVGAEVSFLKVPGVFEDFEGRAPGALAEVGHTLEETGFTARVDEAQAAGGKRSLRFIDGPGGHYPFTPHLYYTVNFDRGLVRVAFDLRLDPAAKMEIAWRDYSGNRFDSGPGVTFGPEGQVSIGKETLPPVPVDAWIHVEMSAQLGEAGDGTWDLAITPAGGEGNTYGKRSIPAGFKALEWVGFISYSEAKSSAWVDNIRIVAVEKRQE